MTVRMGERERLVRHAVDNAVDRSDVESAMRDAIDLARSHRPHPNPRVGAVVLTPDGRVRARGSHVAAGLAHAERVAIDAGVERGDTMVVTLEPCDHHGATPPCTEAILRAGIGRVIVGALDPDDRVSGRGVARLRDAGVDVVVGVLAEEVEAADRAYFHHRRTGRAFATLKVASTLDGQVAALDGTSRWITSPAAREDAHRLRADHDAVVVGMGTVIADDPRLDVRLGTDDTIQPLPVVLAAERALPDDSHLAARGALVLRDPAGVPPDRVLRTLPDHGALSALIEGGPSIARAFLDAHAVDEVVWYVAGRLAGGTGTPAIAGTFETIDDLRDLEILDVSRIGPDLRITARPRTDVGE